MSLKKYEKNEKKKDIRLPSQKGNVKVVYYRRSRMFELPIEQC
jgi:hypothetical protein